MANFNLGKRKNFVEDNMRYIIQILTGLMASQSTIESQCLLPYDETKTYAKGQICLYNNYLYLCKTTCTGPFDESKWSKQTDSFDELDLDTIKTFLGLTPEEIQKMSDLISDSEVRLDKTYSSSKIYMSIQAAIDTSKTYTLSEIGKMSGASYKVVNSTTEMTDERIIYLLASGSTYDMYIVEADGTPTKIGDTTIDLSDYLTKTDAENTYLKKTDADGKYATITTVDGKVNKADISTTISSTPSDEKVVSEKAVKTELDKKVDNTIILKTADEVNSFDRAYQSFIVNKFIADAIGLPGSPSSTWFCIHFSHSKGYTYPSQIAFEYAGLERIMYRTSIKGVWGTWRKISTTGVKDIPKTNIAPADETKFVGFKGNHMCNYCVQNGICYVSLWGVQVTVTGRVNTGVILPMPKSGFFGGGYLTGGGDAITHAYAHTIPETGELKFNVKDANTVLYGAFSYPVAES